MIKYLSSILLMMSLSIACQPKAEQANTSQTNQTATKVAEINPQKLYEQYCSTCHGAEGNANISDAKDLTVSTLDKDQVIAIIKNGSENGKMMAYGKLLKPKQVKALSDYVISLRAE